jgi:excisionase family DNA binding protein
MSDDVMSDKGMTIAEAAAVLGVPRTWVRDKVTAREIPHHRIGRHVRFFADDIKAIKKQSARPATTTTQPVVLPRRRQRRAA